MGLKIVGGVAANQELDINTSGEALTRITTVDSRAGHVSILAENDDGTVTGERYMKAIEVSEDYRLRVGMDSILFNQSFEGTIFSSDRLNLSASTMTFAQASGVLSINSGNATASGNYCIIHTRRTFPIYGSFVTHYEFWLREAEYDATNAVSEFGVGYLATTAAPTDGVFVRRLSGGDVTLIVNTGGVERELTLDTTNIPSRTEVGPYSPTEINHWVLSLHNDEVEVWCNDARLGSLKAPSTHGALTQSGSGRIQFRVYNSGVASAARRIEVGFLSVSVGDMNQSKSWAHQISDNYGGSYQVQPGSAVAGTVARSSANFGWPASTTALVVGTWTATSAPAANTLGGRWISPAMSTLTSEADYPVFAYLNPVGTATLPGKNLKVTGVRVGETIAMAAASTNGILLCYALGVAGTAAATSTADGNSASAPRIVPLGQCYFKSSAVIGDTVPGYELNFETPLLVPPGSYIMFIVRPVGTVGSNTLTVTGMVTFMGYFD